MDQVAVLDVIRQFRLILTEKGIVVDRIVLFGSHASNTQRPDSDIDLVVISESFRNMSYWQRIHLLADAISDIFQPIEATGMTDEEWNSNTFTVAGYARNGQVVA